jgi:hypothetical protein
MHSLQGIIAQNKDVTSGFCSRPLSASAKQEKVNSKERFYLRHSITDRIKTIGIGLACVALSFTAGINTNKVEAYSLDNGQITMTFEECIQAFESFYINYPSYHYEMETETQSISIDYIVPNPEEEAWQYCGFFFEVY